ncbi:patatin family protein [bacterium]|nr:patatin family protein [bacterium]
MSEKTGLVLEGGAMRGMFTTGVLDVFMENGITFNGMIGVSAGATFGCNFKSKQIGRAIRYNKKYAHDRRYCSLHSLFTSGDLYNTDFCYNILPNQLDLFDYETFNNNPMEFYVVATDAEKGTPVYRKFIDCSLKDMTWMRASASMPLVSRPVEIDGGKFLDGGTTDSIPLEYFESIGYTKNVVVLTQPRDFVKQPVSGLFLMKILLRKYPKLIEALKRRHNVYNEQKSYVFSREKAGAALVICPEKALGISRTEKNVDELERVYQEGRAVATKRLEEIKSFLRRDLLSGSRDYGISG